MSCSFTVQDNRIYSNSVLPREGKKIKLSMQNVYSYCLEKQEKAEIKKYQNSRPRFYLEAINNSNLQNIYLKIINNLRYYVT